MISSGNGGSQSNNPIQTTSYLSASDLSSMSESDIRSLGNDRGYTIVGTTRQDVVDSFLQEQLMNFVFTQTELNKLTISEINDIATARGYTITQTLKADIIQEFLEQQ